MLRSQKPSCFPGNTHVVPLLLSFFCAGRFRMRFLRTLFGFLRFAAPCQTQTENHCQKPCNDSFHIKTISLSRYLWHETIRSCSPHRSMLSFPFHSYGISLFKHYLSFGRSRLENEAAMPKRTQPGCSVSGKLSCSAKRKLSVSSRGYAFDFMH